MDTYTHTETCAQARRAPAGRTALHAQRKSEARRQGGQAGRAVPLSRRYLTWLGRCCSSRRARERALPEGAAASPALYNSVSSPLTSDEVRLDRPLPGPASSSSSSSSARLSALLPALPPAPGSAASIFRGAGFRARPGPRSHRGGAGRGKGSGRESPGRNTAPDSAPSPHTVAEAGAGSLHLPRGGRVGARSASGR